MKSNQSSNLHHWQLTTCLFRAVQRWLFITLLSTFSGSNLSPSRAPHQCPRILLRTDKDLHPVCERPQPAGGVAEGPGGRARHHHPEGVPGLEGAQELEPAAGVSDRDLHLLEALEGQEPHHGAQGAPEAGVGRHHHPEALQEVAGGQVAHRPRPQPPLGVAHLPGLAPHPRHHEGDQLPTPQTVSQMEGECPVSSIFGQTLSTIDKIIRFIGPNFTSDHLDIWLGASIDCVLIVYGIRNVNFSAGFWRIFLSYFTSIHENTNIQPFQCERFRTRFDQTARNRMREKVTASLIFKDRKSSYPRR